MASSYADTLRTVFVTGLRNAHAVEHQALALIDRQLDRLVSYPEIADRLRSHRGETEQQITRIDEILSSLNESASGLKDLGLSISGNAAALMHTVAGDEIIKNSFANYAFENFEAAAYKSLITLADAGSFGSATGLLQQSLGEELGMIQWLDEHLAPTTLKFVQLTADGEKSDR